VAGAGGRCHSRVMAKKRKAKVADVVDLEQARIGRLTSEFKRLAAAQAAKIDEHVGRVLEIYRGWERENPDRALKGFQKMQMVRWGFVGPGGFERCHEEGRRPEDSFYDGPDDLDTYVEELENDRTAGEVLMCPAMEARSCEGIWATHKTPPCHMLLLEVHQGLGGGVIDDALEQVLSDVGRWRGPDEYRESFVRAEKLLRKAKR